MKLLEVPKIPQALIELGVVFLLYYWKSRDKFSGSLGYTNGYMDGLMGVSNSRFDGIWYCVSLVLYYS